MRFVDFFFFSSFWLNPITSLATIGLRENGSRFSPKICVPIETPRREDDEFQFSLGKSATLSVRQRSYIPATYTNSELARALWNEDSYSPDTGVTGKLRDRGRFFITTGALPWHYYSASPPRYKECNPEILWTRRWECLESRWDGCAGVIRRRQQSRNGGNNRADVYCTRCVKDVVRETKRMGYAIACTINVHNAKRTSLRYNRRERAAHATSADIIATMVITTLLLREPRRFLLRENQITR